MTTTASDKKVAQSLACIDAAIARGPFKDTWASLEHYQIPEWYKDAKFGIFIHWGVYSVPAFHNEWYPREMYRATTNVSAYHKNVYGPQSRFGYKDFIPKFKAAKFNAQAWARLFRQSGAKFVMPVAEHHDGFAMYPSKINPWNAATMGPKQDIVGELAEAVRAKDMTFCASSHRAEHWWYFNGGMEMPSDVQNPKYASLYGPAKPGNTQPDKRFLDEWLALCCEIVDKYRPQVFWFDWWIEQPAFEPYLRRFAAYYYNRAAEWGVGVAINYKNKSFKEKSAVLDLERGQLSAIRKLLWQNDTSVSKNSWGYIQHHDYKQTESIIGDLVDVVSKNGALLLNIGPKADGTIPAPEQTMLREIGAWLRVNGEAIYGTRPWKSFGEGPTEVPTGMFTDTKREAFTSEDFRFTAAGRTIYAIAMAWPSKGTLTVKSLAAGGTLAPKSIGSVELLGSPAPLKWKRDKAGLHVTMPARKPCDHAYTLKVR